MAGIIRVGLITVLALVGLAGCSQSGSTGATSDAGQVAGQSDSATRAIAAATTDWLDAVLKGDTQRASARLSPQAMQRIIASGKQFSPPGLETASFKLGEIRIPAPDQAIAQCVLTDTSEGTPHSEEMCCLLRRVDNDWRISGIAYGTSPNQPWTLTDFETGQNTPIPRQVASEPNGAEPQNNGVASRPSPPRATQEPAAAERR